MKAQVTFRNGYLQPETDPSHGSKVLVLILVAIALLFTIYKTCIL
jgi:hypothetical protein